MAGKQRDKLDRIIDLLGWISLRDTSQLNERYGGVEHTFVSIAVSDAMMAYVSPDVGNPSAGLGDFLFPTRSSGVV